MAQNPGIAEIKAKVESEIRRKTLELEELRKKLAAAEDLAGFFNNGRPAHPQSDDAGRPAMRVRPYARLTPGQAPLAVLRAAYPQRMSARRIYEELVAGGWKSDSKNKPVEAVASTLVYLEKKELVNKQKDEHGNTWQSNPESEAGSTDENGQAASTA